MLWNQVLHYYPGALLMGAMMPASGRLFDKFGIRCLAITGFTIITVTGFLFTQLETGTIYGYVLTVYMIRMIGISLVIMPLMTAGINRLYRKLISHGTAMNNTMRLVGGSIGTTILVTVMFNAITSTGQPMPEDMIGGVYSAFMVATLLALAGAILTLFVKK
jgi:MFS family permease